jgi:putative membrane protein
MTNQLSAHALFPALLLALLVAAASAELASTDRTFLKQCDDALAAYLEFARTGESNANTEEVKFLARDLVSDHARSLAAIRELSKMKGVESSAEPTMAQRGAIQELASKQGTAFDEAYRKQVMKNHEDAIRVVMQGARDAKDPDIRAFAEQLLGELKDRHLAMGGEPVRLTGSVGLKVAKPKQSPPAKSTAGKGSAKGQRNDASARRAKAPSGTISGSMPATTSSTNVARTVATPATTARASAPAATPRVPSQPRRSTLRIDAATGQIIGVGAE